MKHLNISTILIMLMSMVGVEAFAHDFEVANADGVTIYYVKTSDTEVAVSYQGGYRSSYSDEYTGYVNIPENVYYDGITYSVTSIGEDAFYECSNLTWVVIPNSVVSIGNNSFQGCTGLSFIVIPESVTSIGSYAFSGCSSLGYIEIPNSVTEIGGSTFKDCTSLSTVIISNSITRIPYSTFEGCTSLTDVDIPNGVTNIDSNAFKGCTNLASIVIPNTMKDISNYYYSSDIGPAFSGCTNLTKVTLNSNSIASSSSFTKIFGEQVTEYILGDDVKTIPSSAFSNCVKLTSVTIGEGVTSIGSSAFQNCSALTSINIPESVTSIGRNAFYGCYALTSVNIPESVTKIETATFNGCRALTSINIPNASIENYAFSWCSKLTSVTLGDGVTKIGTHAFEYCGLTSITIPSSVNSISEDAFYSCSDMKQVTINSTIVGQLNKLSSYFGGQVTEYILGEGVTYIGANAFDYCTNLTSVTIPSTVTYIETEAFNRCKSLTSIILPEGLTTIGEKAFASSGLTSITIPEGVTSIYRYAFAWCENLSTITIPDGVQSISEGTFSGCSGLTSITIPKGVTTIGNQAFSSCTNLTQVILNSNDIVSATYTEKSDIASIFGTQVKDYILGDEVQSIGDYAFNSCAALNSITFGDNIQTIGSNALPACNYYVNRGTYGLLHLWNSGLEPMETGTTDILYHPSVTVSDVTQTTATVQLNNINYEDYTFTYGDQEITSTDFTLTGLRPEQSLPCLKASLGEVSFSTGDDKTTSAISPFVTCSQTATAITATGSYIEGDAHVTGQRMTLNGTTEDGNNIKVTKLEPGTTYTVNYEIDVAYGDNEQDTYTYTGAADVTTDFVTLTTQSPKVISAGNVVVSAESNLDDEEANVGFEWRRMDWGADFASNTGKAYFYEGTLEGFIRNLNFADNTLWKCRPYYESEAGKKYYGEWTGIDPMNVGDYEPTVHTYSTFSVDGNTASVKGYVQRGTDNITSQGFKYWKKTSDAPSVSDIPSNAKTTEAKGTVMEASLTSLDNTSSYDYVAFATTSEGDTYYGVIRTLETGEVGLIPGDANGDGVVNVTDIVEIVNNILGHPSDKFDPIAADVNGDGVVNVTDIVSVVNIILSDPVAARELLGDDYE